MKKKGKEKAHLHGLTRARVLVEGDGLYDVGRWH